jgi:acyl-CoA reductase-like NAD-dependent aldehyde dehydrogenase
MSNVPHLPVLRLGRSYESLDKLDIKDHRTGEVRAVVSSINAGILRKDFRKLGEARKALAKFTVAELMAMSAKAGEFFLNGTLPLGDKGHTQTADEYVATLSTTSGLPHVMVRRNMAKLHYALTHLDVILNGLSRGLDMTIIDRGFGEQFGTKLSFFPACQALGLVMPSNSPAVNSLWLPAIALKTPVVITPYRLIQSFIAAGVPSEAFGFYPTDHEGAGEILKSCGRALIFGDKSTTQQYANNPAIQLHGPGWSKFIIGEDCIENWREYIDVIAGAISDNGGRSCINASAVVVPRYAAEIADALAQKLGPIVPTANDFIEASIEDGLATPGAEDVTAKYRGGTRKVIHEGGTFLRPTIVRCDSFAHPLANKEFLCPYASVVTCPQSEMLANIGYTLACSAITKDPAFIAELEAYPEIERLNIGPVSTMAISWDQPHEGNMFEFLWKRRSIERAW